MSKASNIFIRLEHISKNFGGVKALLDVSTDIKSGEIYHLLGENGSGKSTLIKIIAGAQPPSSGTMTIANKTYKKLGALEALQAGIETVYQDLSLFPNLTVAENVAYNAQLVKNRGNLLRLLDRQKLQTVATTALKKVGLEPSPKFLNTPIALLPIALRQQVAIARGVATKAKLVIMDEPTAALTQKEIEHLMAIIDNLRSEGISVIFVSHKLDEVFRIGGNVIVLRDGKKVADGALDDYSIKDIAYLMTGKKLENHRYRKSKPEAEVLLKVENLSDDKDFKGISFDLHRGEVLGITGLLDSGRNELALALSGVQAAKSGTISLNSKTIQVKNPKDAIDLGIAYVPEDRLAEGLFLEKPIRENISIAILDKLLSRNQIDNNKMVNLANKFRDDLAIASSDVMQPAQSLSGGNQQKVMLARWLAIEPKVLLLHGPTVGVDVGSKDAIYKIVQELAQKGLGVIIVSDDLPELLQNCDYILLMKNGQIAHTFDAENIAEKELSKTLLEA